MKRLISLVLIFLFLMGCNRMSAEQKAILNNYVELSSEDYLANYEYLTGECRIVSIDYNETMKKLKKDSFVLYVGGAWCPNCQASIKFINDVAIETGLVVYNFDTRIGGKRENLDIRNCENKASYDLYKDFIEASEFVHPEGITTENTDVYRLSVPTVLVYDKGVLVGYNSAEYLYDGITLFDPIDIENEDKIDYSKNYYNNLLDLFRKII